MSRCILLKLSDGTEQNSESIDGFPQRGVVDVGVGLNCECFGVKVVRFCSWNKIMGSEEVLLSDDQLSYS